jgi:hypothetical protein
LNSDVRAGRPAPATRPATLPARPPAANTRPIQRPPANAGNRPAQRPPAIANRPPAAPPNNWHRPPGSNGNGYYNGYRGSRTVIVNPVYRGPAWGWNRGVIWTPLPIYWGGGFWGAWAIGVTSAVVFGAIVNSTTQQTISSYAVQPNSPGATLLKNYQLTQVECGPPNLVVIFGPDNSVICARPNHLVAAGQYDLDAQQLSIIAR